MENFIFCAVIKIKVSVRLFSQCQPDPFLILSVIFLHSSDFEVLQQMYPTFDMVWFFLFCQWIFFFSFLSIKAFSWRAASNRLFMWPKTSSFEEQFKVSLSIISKKLLSVSAKISAKIALRLPIFCSFQSVLLSFY